MLRLQKCGRGFLYPCLKFKRLLIFHKQILSFFCIQYVIYILSQFYLNVQNLFLNFFSKKICRTLTPTKRKGFTDYKISLIIHYHRSISNDILLLFFASLDSIKRSYLLFLIHMPLLRLLMIQILHLYQD